MPDNDEPYVFPTPTLDDDLALIRRALQMCGEPVAEPDGLRACRRRRYHGSHHAPRTEMHLSASTGARLSRRHRPTQECWQREFGSSG